MFLALTLLLTLLQISSSTRRKPKSFKFGRSGLNDAYRGSEEYLEGDDCDPKIYNCDNVSSKESTVTPSPNGGDDCDTQVYDCNDYSYEIMNAVPPVPAKPQPVKPPPVKPHDHGDGHGGGNGAGNGGGHGDHDGKKVCILYFMTITTGSLHKGYVTEMQNLG